MRASLAVCIITCAGIAHAATDILSTLEREVAGKLSPFLSSRHGSYYIGGQSIAQVEPLTSLWPVTENETLGFMHPFFRDGRARGEAIVCDDVPGVQRAQREHRDLQGQLPRR